MSWALRVAFFVLWAAFAAAPASAEENAPPAEAALRAYFAALDAQDCDAVERLRPGYGRNCKLTEAVTVDTLDDAGQAGALQVFRVTGTITRTAPEPFSLDFPLEERDGGWVIVHEEVGASFDMEAHRIASEVAARTEEAAEADPAQPLKSEAPAPAPEMPAPAPEMLDTAPEMPAPKLADSTDEARAVIERYYDALREGRCTDVQDLRPEYPMDKCARVTAVEGPSIVALGPYEGLELFHIVVKLTLGDEVDEFAGYAAVKQRFPDRVIVSDLVIRDLPLDDYKEEVARYLQATSAAPAPAADYDPETMLDWGETGLVPARPGSAAVLRECWAAGELAHRPGEELSYTSGDGVFMGPPARLSPKTGIAPLPPELRGSIRSVDTGGARYIALTFDVGEQNNDHAGYDGEIVDYLRDQKVRATFYLGGKWMATHSERAMQLIADPRFETGNHGWTHGNMRVLGRDDSGEAENQILFTQAQYELLREKLRARAADRGVPARERDAIPLQLATFRYPYGACSPETLAMVNRFGLPAVQWSIVSGDPDRGQSARDIADGVLRQAHPGAIVVMHANGRGWNTAEALRIFVPALRDRGYDFVTVSELLTLGDPVAVDSCYETRPGDNLRYDRVFGRGTGD